MPKTTTTPAPDKVGESPAYWTNKIDDFTGPVAQFRMSQLVDYDLRLTDPARTVYRFLIGWYVRDRGDALASVRHIVRVMRQRAPEGARHLSRSAVARAVILLVESGWLVRSFVGKGRSGSRFVPVFNVLELAAQGTLPTQNFDSVPLHRDASAESLASQSTGTQVSHATGTQTALASQPTGTKTLLHDPGTDPGTCRSNSVSADSGPGASAPAASSGFENVWRAYGKHGNKQAARDAFAGIDAPDVDLIAERAASWAASAKPGQRRMPLEKWLSAEKYDEADRRAAPVPANDNEDREMFKPSKTIPVALSRTATARGTIAAATLRKDGASTLLDVQLDTGHARTFTVEGAAGAQERGQNELSQLAAIRGEFVEEPEELIGLAVSLTEFDDGSARWAA